VSFTVAAALIAISSINRKGLDVFAIVGFLVWVIGFGIEVVADAQKSRFNANPENKGKFIQTGLWSRSRHPNYFGEILLWVGITIITLPVLQGWQWIALISPVFVTLLLTRVSGVPLLENKSDKKWGGQEDYEAYKKRTHVLIPRL
jgi:steroid 5-alpha reductase family enzyme